MCNWSGTTISPRPEGWEIVASGAGEREPTVTGAEGRTSSAIGFTVKLSLRRATHHPGRGERLFVDFMGATENGRECQQAWSLSTIGSSTH